jgi:hypothetical protein
MADTRRCPAPLVRTLERSNAFAVMAGYGILMVMQTLHTPQALHAIINHITDRCLSCC